jgi:hypothetical protein
VSPAAVNFEHCRNGLVAPVVDADTTSDDETAQCYRDSTLPQTFDTEKIDNLGELVQSGAQGIVTPQDCLVWKGQAYLIVVDGQDPAKNSSSYFS